MDFRIDKCGVMLKVMICTLLIRVFGDEKVCLRVKYRGDNLVPTLYVCYHVELAISSFTPASYSADITNPGQFQMGAKLFIGTS